MGNSDVSVDSPVFKNPDLCCEYIQIFFLNGKSFFFHLWIRLYPHLFVLITAVLVISSKSKRRNHLAAMTVSYVLKGNGQARLVRAIIQKGLLCFPSVWW